MSGNSFGKVALHHIIYLIYYVLVHFACSTEVLPLPLLKWSACPDTADSNVFLSVYYPDTFGLPQCIANCKGRKACRGVNYWRLTRICELLDTEGSGRVYNETCMFVNRNEMNETTEETERCKNCADPLFCDVKTGSCTKKECPKLEVTNGQILGHVRIFGSKAVVLCKKPFLINGTRSQSRTCRDGSWGDSPSCSQMENLAQPAGQRADTGSAAA